MPRKPKASQSLRRHWRRFPQRFSISLSARARSPMREFDAAVRRFKKAIIERAFGSELPRVIFGYPSGGAKPDDTTNHRNGTSGKTVITDDGPLAIDVPRDREGTFKPQIIPKHERRFTGFDEKILPSTPAA